MKYQTDKGILIEECDELATNPRETFDHFSTFYTFLRNKMSPDDKNFSFREWLESIFSKSTINKILECFDNDDSDGAEKLCESLYKKGYVSLPVWRFAHGNVKYEASLKNPFSDIFDSCFAGIIFCKKEDIWKEYGKRCSKNILEKVKSIFEEEVNQYSNWANGDCFLYYFEGTDEVYGTFYGDISQNGILDVLEIKDYNWIE